MKRFNSRHIFLSLTQMARQRVRSRLTIYLLVGVGGMAALAWVVASQVRHHPPGVKPSRVAVLSPAPQVQSDQMPDSDAIAPVEMSRQPETVGPHVPEGLSEAMTPPTLQQDRTAHERAEAPEGIAEDGDSPSPDYAMPRPSPSRRSHRPTQPASSRQTRNLVVDLLLIPHDFSEELHQTLAELRQHRDAVATIRGLLNAEANGNDSSLDDIVGVNIPDARLRLIDALTYIGSPEAVDTLAQALRRTTRPAEIALLAKGVEMHAPGKYKEDILLAAQATMSLTDGNSKEVLKKLGTLNPLLGVYLADGDAASVPDLEASWPRWTAFSTVALAGLPDGAGIDSLIHFVTDPSVPARRKNFPVQMLAQASRVYPDVGETLITMAEAKQLTDPAWAALARALGGTETVLHTSVPIRPDAQDTFAQGASSTGNEMASGPAPIVQVIYQQNSLGSPFGVNGGEIAYLDYNSQAPAAWSAAEIDQQLVLIDRLLATEPGSDAVKALEKARQSLSHWQQFKLVDGKRKPL